MNRDQIEITEAVAKLEKNLNLCVPYSCFGNDNKKQVLVMLDTIKNCRSRAWINSTYLTVSQMFHEHPDNPAWQSAMDAREWLDSNFSIEELLFKEASPSKTELFKNLLFNH